MNAEPTANPIPEPLDRGADESCQLVRVDPVRLVAALERFRTDPELRFEFLIDLTAVDHFRKRGSFRFELVYRLYSLFNDRNVQIRVELKDDYPVLSSCTSVWPAAGWLEREVFEMFGIRFDGHPDMRPLLLPSIFGRHPLRREYPLRGLGERAASKCGKGRVGGEGRQVEEEREAQIGWIELGPVFPADFEGLRVLSRVKGERIVKLLPDPGYQHAGFEKLGETLSYLQLLPAAERLNLRAPFCGGLAWALAVERLFGMEVPRRGRYIRTMLAELSRIASHLVWLEEQASSVGFRAVAACVALQRKHLYGLWVLLSENGRFPVGDLIRIGGVARDLSPRFTRSLEGWLDGLRYALDRVHLSMTDDPVWVGRARGMGILPLSEAVAWSASGPVLRGSGGVRDLRRSAPYEAYGEVDFDVVVGSAGDVYDRYLVRMEEMEQSIRIVEQLIRGMPDGSCLAEEGRYALPSPEEVRRDPEAMIRHFELWMEGHGLRPPSGAESYVPVEAPGGEFGFYLISDGTGRPFRLRVRTPSFFHYQLFPLLVEGASLPDAGMALKSLDVIPGEVDR